MAEIPHQPEPPKMSHPQYFLIELINEDQGFPESTWSRLELSVFGITGTVSSFFFFRSSLAVQIFVPELEFSLFLQDFNIFICILSDIMRR